MNLHLSRSIVVAALMSSLVVAFASMPSMAQTPPPHSPADEMLVVTANLQEAWGGTTNDMQDMSEMDNFVERLIDQAPYYPDVLLLQEVRRKSARYVKELLTSETGDTYGWGWQPPVRPWTQNPRRRWEMDSAILINTATTRKLTAGGWIELTYPRKHAEVKSKRLETTRHARVSVEEIDGDMKLGAASVHMQYGHLIDSKVDAYQVTWTDKIMRSLANNYPNDVRTFGGDFNEDRCRGGSDVRSCNQTPFWENITSAPWNYEDTLYRVFRNGKQGVGLGGVDFIFTLGRPIDAGSDTSYDKTNPRTFYSDHRFFWGVIGV